MKSEIISERGIKPSSPTPPHLKAHKLSLLDQVTPSIQMNMTFFFLSNNESNDTDPITGFSNKSQLVQRSLSETLSFFYPFAGRFTDAATIDCNDEGVTFFEAKINVQLSEFLKQQDYKLINRLLPTTELMTNGAMLLIQLTSFSCGGLALSLSLSHKVADLAALMTFLNCWTAIASASEPLFPDWTAATRLPPIDELPAMPTPSMMNSTESSIAKRFVFNETKIAELKAKAIASGMQHRPSRVELVLALLWKCAMAANKTKTGHFKPSILLQVVNLRKRMTPSLPENTIGNFVWPFVVTLQEDEDLEVHELAMRSRKAFDEFCDDNANKFSSEEGYSMILRGLKETGEILGNNKDFNVYQSSSWCRFPLYDIDFGWGKPLWHVSVNRFGNNTIVLADTRSRDGIEAVVTLDVEEMAIFERNGELLKYASLNPSAYV